MDNMFINIKELNKIEMTARKDCKILSMISTFENCINLDEFKISGFDMFDLKSMKKLFYKTNINQNISFSSFNSTSLEDISYMFAYTPIKEFKLKGINTDNVKDMSHLFEGCSSLSSVNLTGFNSKNVKDMSYMFNSCKNIKQLDLNDLDTREVINMANMFQSCTSLANLYINEIKTNKVEDMSYMFDNCASLINLDITNLSTDSLKDMSYMFQGCKFKSLNVNNFNTEKVEHTTGTFKEL